MEERRDELRAVTDALEKTLAVTSNDDAFGATIGVLEATVSASHVAAGPRTVDARDLPQIAMVRADEPEAGQDLVVRGLLGEGGMGVVELARQRSLQRDVALKRAKEVGDPRRFAALLQEAVFTGYLEHPSIVPVHALGRDGDGRPLMLMKKIEGATLEALVRDPSHPGWERAGNDRIGFFVEVIRRLADALAFAHVRGVVHRDVKPSNVMLGSFGEVYLLDWGIAMRIGDRLPEDAIAGTLAYMAPEMLRPHEGAIDARTDVYLLGATLHECLTGAPPHSAPTVGALVASITESAPRQYGTAVPSELAAILQRAMDRDPARRFPGTTELGSALGRFVSERPAAALADVAARRLDELEAQIARKAPPSEIHATFHECRFGFEQALRGIPGDARATAGLRSALIAMARFEIEDRNEHAAEALLSRVESPPRELVLALEALRADLAAGTADRERLRQIERDFDDKVGQGERRTLVRFGVSFGALFFLTLVSLRALGLFSPDPRMMAFGMLPFSIVAAFVLHRWRRHFFGNLVTSQMTLTWLVLVVAVATNRVLGAFHARGVGDVAGADALLLAAVSAVSALTLRRLYLVPAGLFLTAAIVAPSFGPRGFVPVILAALASMTAILLSPAKLRGPLLTAENDARMG